MSLSKSRRTTFTPSSIYSPTMKIFRTFLTSVSVSSITCKPMTKSGSSSESIGMNKPSTRALTSMTARRSDRYQQTRSKPKQRSSPLPKISIQMTVVTICMGLMSSEALDSQAGGRARWPKRTTLRSSSRGLLIRSAAATTLRRVSTELGLLSKLRTSISTMHRTQTRKTMTSMSFITTMIAKAMNSCHIRRISFRRLITCRELRSGRIKRRCVYTTSTNSSRLYSSLSKSRIRTNIRITSAK